MTNHPTVVNNDGNLGHYVVVSVMYSINHYTNKYLMYPQEGVSEPVLAEEMLELTKRVGANEYISKVPLGHVGK